MHSTVNDSSSLVPLLLKISEGVDKFILIGVEHVHIAVGRVHGRRAEFAAVGQLLLPVLVIPAQGTQYSFTCHYTWFCAVFHFEV